MDSHKAPYLHIEICFFVGKTLYISSSYIRPFTPIPFLPLGFDQTGKA